MNNPTTKQLRIYRVWKDYNHSNKVYNIDYVDKSFNTKSANVETQAVQLPPNLYHPNGLTMTQYYITLSPYNFTPQKDNLFPENEERIQLNFSSPVQEVGFTYNNAPNPNNPTIITYTINYIDSKTKKRVDYIQKAELASNNSFNIKPYTEDIPSQYVLDTAKNGQNGYQKDPSSTSLSQVYDVYIIKNTDV